MYKKTNNFKIHVCEQKFIEAKQVTGGERFNFGGGSRFL